MGSLTFDFNETTLGPKLKFENLACYYIALKYNTLLVPADDLADLPARKENPLLPFFNDSNTIFLFPQCFFSVDLKTKKKESMS